MIRFAALVAAVILLGAAGHIAHAASKAESLRAQVAREVRAVEQAKTTIRWFERHPAGLYAKNVRVKRRAWHAVALARQQVIRGRARLERLRAGLRAATVPLSPLAAIREVFGTYADQAIRVAGCETGHTFDTGAQNGQYLGLFQMGSWERATYAHGRYTTPLEQTQAAWRYFSATGRDWSPWQCQP